MKNIKTFEGFFDFLKKKQYSNTHYWFETELSDLKNYGFEPEDSKTPNMSTWVLSKIPMSIKKVAFGVNGVEDHFYVVEDLNDNSIDKFETWTDVKKHFDKLGIVFSYFGN